MWNIWNIKFCCITNNHKLLVGKGVKPYEMLVGLFTKLQKIGSSNLGLLVNIQKLKTECVTNTLGILQIVTPINDNNIEPVDCLVSFKSTNSD